VVITKISFWLRMVKRLKQYHGYSKQKWRAYSFSSLFISDVGT